MARWLAGCFRRVLASTGPTHAHAGTPWVRVARHQRQLRSVQPDKEQDSNQDFGHAILQARNQHTPFEFRRLAQSPKQCSNNPDISVRWPLDPVRVMGKVALRAPSGQIQGGATPTIVRTGSKRLKSVEGFSGP